MQQFYNELINGGLKPNSTKKIIEVLTGCYKYAKKLNLVNYIPTDIEKISQEKEKVIVWNEEQLKSFLLYIKDSWLYMPILIISLTGLRVGELCGLRWDNIDLENGFINIREQVIQDKTNHKLIHTSILKTNSAFRSISIPNSLVNLLTNDKLNQSESDSKGFVVLSRDK